MLNWIVRWIVNIITNTLTANYKRTKMERVAYHFRDNELNVYALGKHINAALKGGFLWIFCWMVF